MWGFIPPHKSYNGELGNSLITTHTKEKASMFNNDPGRRTRSNNDAKKTQPAGHNRLMRLSVLAMWLLAVACTCGCFGEVQDPNLQLSLGAPAINQKTVTLNGGVTVPIERIQWEWGDGQIDKHHFFPAEHAYASPGTYRVTVTVFTSNNTSASKSVSIEIK